MPQFLSPIGNSQLMDANGNPLVGGFLETYLAGTSTPRTTFTTQAGGTQQGAVMTLNSLGYPVNGAVWMTGGVALKFVAKNATGVVQSTFDNISGIGDTNLTPDEWVLFAAAPTYVSPTVFTVMGDQTNTFQALRKLKSTNTGGTVYSAVVSAVFAIDKTTVTVTNSVGALDAGLSAVSNGLLAPNNTSIPEGAFGATLRATATQTAARTALGVPELPGQLFGCTLSTAGASTTMSIAAGQWTNSTNTTTVSLAAIAKTTAAWAVGTAVGGLDTGAIAINSWYRFYAIRRPDTGVTDVIFSLNATAPALPAGYTQFRQLGSGRTSGVSQWMLFRQNGDDFDWATPVLDVNITAVATTALTVLTVPTGIRVQPKLAVSVGCSAGTANSGVYAVVGHADDATSAVEIVSTMNAPNNSQSTAQASGFTTDTSARLHFGFLNGGIPSLGTSPSGAAVSPACVVRTRGWVDTRGRL